MSHHLFPELLKDPFLAMCIVLLLYIYALIHVDLCIGSPCVITFIYSIPLATSTFHEQRKPKIIQRQEKPALPRQCGG